MNFFERQDQARHRTLVFCVLFVIAVIMVVVSVDLVAYGIAETVNIKGLRTRYEYDYRTSRVIERAPPGSDMLKLLTATSLATLAIIATGTLYKLSVLSSGGTAVAMLMGGRPIDISASHDDEAMLQNVVEEMSIASGVPVPHVYVMDQEHGINAFAAGYTQDDATICVTRGTLDSLTRDELQGVIAHEFSHILNGDMRLNLQMVGVLNGILVISLIGLGMLRVMNYRPRFRVRLSGKSGGGEILFLIVLGAALYAIGSIGVFFGRLIQSAVSRQREFLADASAAQFTRNPMGLANALKKIGAAKEGSHMMSPHAMETAHLFFANGFGQSFFQWFATHPPLEDRIRALDPAWNGRFIPVTQVTRFSQAPSSSPYVSVAEDFRSALIPQRITESAGTIAPENLTIAAGLLAAIPPDVQDASRSPFGARAVVFALLAGSDVQTRPKQLAIVQQETETACYELTTRLVSSIVALGKGAWLTVLDSALPALRQLSPRQAERFLGTIRKMIDADGRITFFEYALGRIVEKQLASIDLPLRSPIQYFAVSGIRDDAAVLLSALAEASTSHTDKAYASGIRELFPSDPPPFVKLDRLNPLERTLQRLAQSSPAVKRRLIEAMAKTVAVDGEVSVGEMELLRVTAATLDVPLPPIVANAL